MYSSQKKPPHPLNLLQTHISSHPRSSLFIIFLLIPFLVIYIAHTFPNCIAAVYRLPLRNGAVSQTKDLCPSGKVYAYDLPSQFNTDLLSRNCTDLNPARWLCGNVSNHGHGAPAVELRRIMPENLSRSWYRTNQFALELIFHDRILKHKCRTMEPGSATAFYIPFYAGLAVGEYLWTNDTSKQDHLCEMLVHWIKNQKYWKRSNGSDHFITIGRITWDFRRLTVLDKKWGSIFLNMPEMQNVTRFIIEKDPGDAHEVGVPYPTGFHPTTKDALDQWQNFARDHNRSSLFTFIGARRNWVSHDFRALLLGYCQNEPDFCRLVDCDTAHCATDPAAVLEAFLGSEFCLQPKGDSYTRRSVFDCMLAGSVPVFFWNQTAYDQYEWFLPGEPESYSVFIDHEVVRNGSGVIKQVLMKYSKEEIRRKREKVIETIPRIICGMGNGGLIRSFKDAFDIAFDGVLERIRKDKEWPDLL
ncbi:xyloglucan galactosyltransferase katamari1 [Phtheirospermum japonicum]|uniref:Xyloglucan galactosyltransferase katamari1 n=1 Tax=Phtheirospermum japonicum TaxID=374723 RepID=A0A830BA91_9LAMI|nr:xyloglucan galactosyltransferase katamari1 [Phtheirospermum japonicum]